VGEDGRDHFYGHPKKSAEMADAILRRLKFDNKGREQIVTLVLHHDDRPQDKRLKALRLVEEIGYPLAYDLCHITLADSGAQNPQHPVVLASIETAKRFRSLLERLEKEGVPCRISDLAITGEDLAGVGVARGPKMGEILKHLLHDIFEERVENNREDLLARVQKVYLK
jgi:tRNA nucleotidyltransferase (CCA-adding enzyme)